MWATDDDLDNAIPMRGARGSAIFQGPNSPETNIGCAGGV